MLPTFDFANILFAGPCNLRCPYCIGRQLNPALSPPNLAEFPPRNLDALLALIRRHGIREVTLTGTTTDPQLYRHEARLLALLRDQLPPETRISLHTNGQLALAKLAVFNQYDRVTVSFPSFEPATYFKLMGSPRVPNLAEIMRRADVPVKISAVLTADNAAEIDSFLARCAEIGVRRLVYRRLFGDTRDWSAALRRLPRRADYRGNPVFDFHGLEVTYWQFEQTASTAINLFSDGTISTDYLLAAANRQPATPPAWAATAPCPTSWDCANPAAAR